MSGTVRYCGIELLGKYYCPTCGEIHSQRPASEEYVMKTGWVMLDDVCYNIGLCNGVHAQQINMN